MSDKIKPSEISLSTIHGVNYGDGMGSNSLVSIDKGLLIDSRQLSVGAVISDGTNSTVYEGLWASLFA